MGFEKKAALVCVVILVALFVVGLTNREQRSVPNGATEGHRAETRRILNNLRNGESGVDAEDSDVPPTPADDVEDNKDPDAGEDDERVDDKPSFRIVQVRSRDNFSRIAKRELGAANHYPILINANPNLRPRSLRAGQDVRIPIARGDSSTPKNKGSNTKPNNPRDYRVRKDETLSGIAQSHYGKASDWKKIFAANRQKLRRPESLQSGMTIRLP